MSFMNRKNLEALVRKLAAWLLQAEAMGLVEAMDEQWGLEVDPPPGWTDTIGVPSDEK